MRGVHQSSPQGGFKAGKLRDNDWIVDFASTCFSGPALRWFESLDTQVQEDWKLLREPEALLLKYPSEGAPVPYVFCRSPFYDGREI